MTDKNSSDMKDIAGLPAEADDTMEREVHVEQNQKLPLHPVIADDEDAQDNLSLSKKDDLIAGAAGDDSYDADNTETSAVSAFGNSVDSADSKAAGSASAGTTSNAGTKATSAASISSFPLPDLREREDGGAINFEEDEPVSSKN